MYKIGKSKLTDIEFIFNSEDESYIPFDEGNSEYKKYLVWLAQGNTPEEFDNG